MPHYPLPVFVAAFVPLFLGLSCTHAPSRAKESPMPELTVTIDQRQFALRATGANSQNGTSGETQWYANPIAVPAGTSAETIKERRRSLFQSFFQDERDPYTGKLTAKSKCLKKSAGETIAFSSGPPTRWADCHLNGGFPVARRSWHLCAGVLWEITVLSAKSFSFATDCKSQ